MNDNHNGALVAQNNTAVAVTTFDDLVRAAKYFAQSRLFNVKSEAQAVTLFLKAQADGVHFAKAFDTYHVFETGQVSIKTLALQSNFLQRGGQIEWLERTDTRVTARFTMRETSLEVTWDEARARKAGLWGKNNWNQFPAQMLSSRVLAEGIRAIDPASTLSLYTVDEVRDFDDPADFNKPMPTSAPAPAPAKTKASEKKAPTKQKVIDAEIVKEEPKKPAPKANKKSEKEATEAFIKMMRELEKEDAYTIYHVLGDNNFSTDFEKIPVEFRRTAYKLCKKALDEIQQAEEARLEGEPEVLNTGDDLFEESPNDMPTQAFLNSCKIWQEKDPELFEIFIAEAGITDLNQIKPSDRLNFLNDYKKYFKNYEINSKR
jgi:hypothetical protein